MAISDGIGGTCTGAVLGKTGTDIVVSAPTSVSGTVATVTTTVASFSAGQFLQLGDITMNGVAIPAGTNFEILAIGTSTLTIRVPSGAVFVNGSSPVATPYQLTRGLLNTRQSQIQGIESSFLTGTDKFSNALGNGCGFVPNEQVQSSLPGGMTVPTTPYTVKRYMVNLALGLCTQDKLWPTKWMASQLAVEITLELAENCIYQPVGLPNVSAPSYAVGNVALIPEIIEFDDTYDNNFLATLESGGVPIKFSTWNYYQFNTQSSSKLQLQISERSRSVKGLIAVQRRAQGGFQYDSHACIYDSYEGTNQSSDGSSMKDFQYRIGGRYFPGQPVEMCLSGTGLPNGGAEAYTELSKFLNIVGDARLSTNTIPLNWAIPPTSHRPVNLLPEYDYSYTIHSFNKYGQPNYALAEKITSPFAGNAPSCMFVAAINFETSNGIEISGLNAEEQSDISFLVSWTKPQSKEHNIEVFAYTDRMWVIKVFFILTLSQTTMWILFNSF